MFPRERGIAIIFASAHREIMALGILAMHPHMHHTRVHIASLSNPYQPPAMDLPQIKCSYDFLVKTTSFNKDPLSDLIDNFKPTSWKDTRNIVHDHKKPLSLMTIKQPFARVPVRATDGVTKYDRNKI